MGKYVIDSRPAPVQFEVEDALGRTLQNVKNLLMCRMGEVPYDRKRGVDPTIYDMSITDTNSIILQEITRVLGWEPGARALSAAVTLDDNGETIITVVAEIDG